MGVSDDEFVIFALMKKWMAKAMYVQSIQSYCTGVHCSESKIEVMGLTLSYIHTQMEIQKYPSFLAVDNIEVSNTV